MKTIEISGQGVTYDQLMDILYPRNPIQQELVMVENGDADG